MIWGFHSLPDEHLSLLGYKSMSTCNQLSFGYSGNCWYVYYILVVVIALLQPHKFVHLTHCVIECEKLQSTKS